jgi:hypothetical protein
VRVRAPRPRGGLPTFFIIGASKAGTTSLHHYLNQHPQIQMSTVKEPSYFANVCGAPDDERKVRSLDRYELLFDPKVAVRGEASPSYTLYPLRHGVPERIRTLVPQAKLVYMVRDPVERTLSHYHQLVASNGEQRSLREVLRDLPGSRSPCVCASRYALQLDRYLQSFPQERLLVVDQAELLLERRSALSRIFAFLGVDEGFESPEFQTELLKSSGRRVYPPGLAHFVGHRVRPHSHLLPARVRRALRQSIERTFLPELEMASIDEEARTSLQELYGVEVQRLRALTGQAFASWSV